MEHGVTSVEGAGQSKMLVWCADSQATQLMVLCISLYTTLIFTTTIVMTGATAYLGVSHNRVAWPYIISAISCNGSESQLLDCLHGTHFADCGQTEAAYAHCQPGKHTEGNYCTNLHHALYS